LVLGAFDRLHPLVDIGDETLCLAHADRLDQIVLGFESAVEGGGADSGAPGDLAHAGAFDAEIQECRQRALQ